MEEKNIMTEFAKYCKAVNSLTNEALGNVPAAMIQPVLAELHNGVAGLAQQQLAAEIQRLEEKPQGETEG